MIKVMIHSVEHVSDPIITKGSIATKYLGSYKVEATVTCIKNNRVMWQIQEQEFIFHNQTSTSFEVWEVRVEGVFKDE